MTDETKQKPRRGLQGYICDCCEAEVKEVGIFPLMSDTAWTCKECRYEWYDPSGPYHDNDAEKIGANVRKLHNRVRSVKLLVAEGKITRKDLGL